VESRVKKGGVVMRERLVVVRPSVVVVGYRSASINLKPQPSTLSPRSSVFIRSVVRFTFYLKKYRRSNNISNHEANRHTINPPYPTSLPPSNHLSIHPTDLSSSHPNPTAPLFRTNSRQTSHFGYKIRPLPPISDAHRMRIPPAGRIE
jgi:hypothetical protein